MADIFISYASHDLARVEPIVEHLTDHGFSVWWDRKLQGGAMFSREIEAEVQKAKVVIVVWSPASLESRWVADEVDLALQTGKLVPISIDGVKAPMGFRQIQTIDFSAWRGGKEPCLETLLNAVQHHTSEAAETKDQARSHSAAPREISEASIAVLPFVDMSPEKDQDYFTDGISEELLNLLAKIPNLKVTARTSSFAFKNSEKKLSEIGEILGVAHILEGSLRKAGNRIRVTAQLIKAETDFHIWSETYNGNLDDIFEVQDEIAASIVKALKEHLLGDVAVPEAKSSKNVEAYEYYIKGQQLLTQRIVSEMEEAIVGFEEALNLDPNYAPAMVGLADAHYLLSDSPGCYGTTPVQEAATKAMALLERALELDPNLAEAYTIRSMGLAIAGDHKGAIEDARKAIELNPNSVRSWRVLTQTLGNGGNPHEDYTEAQEKSLQLDPLSRVDLFNQSGLFLDLNRIEEAQEFLARIRTADPTSLFADADEVIVDLTLGNYKDALRHLTERPDLRMGQVGAWTACEIMTAFGYGPLVEHIDRAQALMVYCTHGNLLEANRLGDELEAAYRPDEIATIRNAALSAWHSLNGRFERVLEIQDSKIPKDPEDWGPHFNPNSGYLGARLVLLAAHELGQDDLRTRYRDKMSETAEVLLKSEHGVDIAYFKLAAAVAAIDGDNEKALSCLETYVERQPIFAFEIAHDETFKNLSQEPRFLALIEKCRARIASEKLAAFEAGLLPPSPALTAATD